MMTTIAIAALPNAVRAFLLRPDIVLRLNPSWFLKEMKSVREGSYEIMLYDDKTDDDNRIVLSVRQGVESITYVIDSKQIIFTINEVSAGEVSLSIGGDFLRVEDVPFWLRGLKNYIQLERRQSKVMKWFLDRIWLRMTPSQRRITMIVLIAEGLGFIALVVVIVALKVLR